MENTYKDIVYHVSLITMIENVILAVFKLIAGIYGHSHAMISDSIHSISDVMSTIIVMIGVHFSSMPEDQNHPYGHERMECIAAMILSILLILTGFQIGYQSFMSLIHHQSIIIPSFFALFASIISIVVKEIMYLYTRYYAFKINSLSLMADAYHHRSDAFSSIGSLVGIGASMIGFPIFDPLTGIIIALFILKPGISIFYDASIKMIDHSCSKEITDKLISSILKQKEVICIDSLKTRLFGEKYYVDLEIGVNEDLSLKEAHNIADNVHDHIEHEFPNIKHCMIHVNPTKLI